VLHEMLTGISPFAGESIPTVCNQILSSTPQPPSRSNPSIPSVLDEIVASCLVKEPQQRVASAEGLAERLFPLARRTPTPSQQVAVGSPEPTLRSRAGRLLRSA